MNLIRSPYVMALSALCLVTFLAFAAPPAHAQEEDSGLQIDLEALQGLNPGREDKSSDPNSDDAGPAEEPDEIVIPAPPGSTDTNSGTPPVVETSPADNLAPEPQTPKAPKPTIVSTTPARRTTARALTDVVIPVLFQPDSQQIGIKAAESLDNVLAKVEGKGVRLQLMAYAGNEDSSESEARRLALQRAIAVRGYLMEKGLAGTAIDVRPQGRAEDSPKERVDIIFLPQ